MFFLELNHGKLKIWYQIDQCHFAYTAESLAPYSKLCGLLTQTSIFSTGTNCRLMEGKLSVGISRPSSISFNDNSIVRNFYPKKFHSSKLFKDLLPTWREFSNDHLWLQNHARPVVMHIILIYSVTEAIN